MADAFAREGEVLSEDAFLELTGLTQRTFRGLVRADELPGAYRVFENSYIVIMSEFIVGVQE